MLITLTRVLIIFLIFGQTFSTTTAVNRRPLPHLEPTRLNNRGALTSLVPTGLRFDRRRQEIYSDVSRLLLHQENRKRIAALIYLSDNGAVNQNSAQEIRKILTGLSDDLTIVMRDKRKMSEAGVPPEALQALETLDPHFTIMKNSMLKDGNFHNNLPKLVDYFVDQIPLKKIAEISQKSLLDPDNGIKFDGMAEDLRKAVQAILSDYFNNLTPSMKKKTIAGFLENYHGSYEKLNVDEGITALVQSSGPSFQKLIQILSDDIKNPIFRELLGSVKSKIPPMKEAELRKVLHANFLKPGDSWDKFSGPNGVFDSFEMKPIACGSIAQAHRAVLNGREVVVKVKRFNIEKTMNEEFKIFDSIAEKVPIVRNLVNDMKVSLLEEVDFKREISNIRKGAKGYENFSKTRMVAKPVTSMVAKSGPNVIVLERAKGTEISNLVNGDLHRQIMIKSAINSLSKRWLLRSLLGDGFFHADTHGGNLFLSSKGGGFSGNKPLLTMIDFGNSGRLTVPDRVGFVSFAWSVHWKKFSTFKYALKKLVLQNDRITNAKIDSLESKFRQIVNNEHFSLEQKLNELYSACHAAQIEFRPVLTQFFRGIGFQENLKRDTNIRIRNLSQ